MVRHLPPRRTEPGCLLSARGCSTFDVRECGRLLPSRLAYGDDLPSVASNLPCNATEDHVHEQKHQRQSSALQGGRTRTPGRRHHPAAAEAGLRHSAGRRQERRRASVGSDQALVCLGTTTRAGSGKESAEAQGETADVTAEARDVPGEAPGRAENQQEDDACKEDDARVQCVRPPPYGGVTVRVAPAQCQAHHAQALGRLPARLQALVSAWHARDRDRAPS